MNLLPPPTKEQGSEIARQITTGLVEKGIKVFFVTHQIMNLLHGFIRKNKMPKCCFSSGGQGSRTAPNL